MGDAIDVSVIIPHYNDLDRLALCLNALGQQSYPLDQFEIVVADNQSPCGLTAVEKVVAGRARVVNATERGAGPARNEGVQAARGKTLAFTDCDCIPDRDWIANGLRSLGKRKLVGGEVVVFVRNEDDLSGAEAFERVFAFNNRRYVTNEHFSVTANLFCDREVFGAVGGFRTGVSEDKEWCLRARAAGIHIVYASDAIVGHPAREDFDQLRGKWRRINAESYLLVSPGLAGSLYWLGRTWMLLPSIAVHALTIVTSPKINGSWHRLRALATLVHIRLWRFIDGHRLLLGKRA